MKKLVVYSHDTFGLGNIKRMLAITQQLLDTIPDLSVLLISGSPVIHHFSLPEKRFDYLKLPCLGRTVKGEYTVKRLGTQFDELVAVRTQIIQATVANFDPDIILVDKKPRGIADELLPTLELVRGKSKQTQVVLLLRDILDDPETTSRIWLNNDYFRSIERYYNSILVMGEPKVFDVGKEYRFPESAVKKLEYCGYTRRPRSDIGLELTKLFPQGERPRVLVTAGGGEDGFELLKTYLTGISINNDSGGVTSIIVTGPEMSMQNRNEIYQTSARLEHVQTIEFTPNLMEYMRNADLIISMAGYNTIVEILSMNKRAVVVPRVKPVHEQLIRAKRLEQLGLLTCVSPTELTPQRLLSAVSDQLSMRAAPIDSVRSINFNGLPNLTGQFKRLFDDCSSKTEPINSHAIKPVIPYYLPGASACLAS